MTKVQVRLLVSRAGPNGAENVGDEPWVDADEAKRMIAEGQAVPKSGKVERASKPPKSEKATR